MHKTFCITASSAILALAAPLFAQQAPPLFAQQKTEPASKLSKLDFAVTYTGIRSLNANSSQNFWMQGGSVQVGAYLWHGLGIAADFTGTHAASIASSAVPLSLITLSAGPRYRWHPGHLISPYGELLLGYARGFDSLFPTASGATSSSNSFALQVSGGVDVKIAHNFAVRVPDVGWLRTQLANGNSSIQNSLRLGGGLVFVLPPRVKPAP